LVSKSCAQNFLAVLIGSGQQKSVFSALTVPPG